MLRANSEFVGYGVTKGILVILSQYPAFVEHGGIVGPVTGEVYKIRAPVKVFKELDTYEGSEFKRELININMESGEKKKCWIYKYVNGVDGLSIIKSGDYNEYRNSPKK